MPLPFTSARTVLAHRDGRAVLAAFVLTAVVFGNWVARVPAVQAHLGLTDGELGLGLIGIPIGSVTAVLVGGGLVERLGAGRTLAAALLLLPVAAIGPAAAESLPALFLAAVAFGLCNGLLSVAANVEAVAFERRLGTRVITVCHGGYSLGGMAGAATGALAAQAGLVPAVHLAIVAGVLVGAGLLIRPAVLALPASEAAPGGPVFALPRGPLVPLALVAVLALAGESVVGNWSAVYLSGPLGQTPAAAALGYVAFSAAMATGRLVGDGVVDRLGDAPTMRWALLLASGGLGAALLVGDAAVAVAGFACAGLGFSVVVPAFYRAGARAPGVRPGAGFGAIASAGNVGVVIQPVVVGALSDAVGLPRALGVAVAAIFVAALVAPAAFRRAAGPSPSHA